MRASARPGARRGPGRPSAPPLTWRSPPSSPRGREPTTRSERGEPSRAPAVAKVSAAPVTAIRRQRLLARLDAVGVANPGCAEAQRVRQPLQLVLAAIGDLDVG